MSKQEAATMENYLTTNNPFKFNMPIYKWELRLDPSSEVVFYKQTAPNWFYCLMQRLILGIYWRRK